jgi:hypothetical protein
MEISSETNGATLNANKFAETDFLMLASNVITDATMQTFPTDVELIVLNPLVVMELLMLEKLVIPEFFPWSPTNADLAVPFPNVEMGWLILCSENLVMTETTLLEMDVILLVEKNVVTEIWKSTPRLVMSRSVTLELAMQTLPILVEPTADSHSVVMEFLTPLKNVITELTTATLSPMLAELTAEFLIVVMVSLILLTARNVTKEPTMMILL